MNELDLSLNTAVDQIPNKFPTVAAPYRIAVIGDCVKQADFGKGQPFTSPLGDLVFAVMNNCGIAREACFVGNVCQFRPPSDALHNLPWDGQEVQQSLQTLSKDLKEFKPNLCILLGDAPMTAAFGEVKPSRSYRGSLFQCDRLDSPFYNLKFICSFDPADVQKQYTLMPLFASDLRRAREEGEFSDLRLPQRTLDIHLTAFEIIQRLEAITPSDLVSIDIEGGIQQGMSCLSISTDPLNAFIVSFGRHSVEEEALIYRALHRVLNSNEIPKCLQNSLYDRMVLAYRYGLLVRNVREDTMLKAWEIYSELPKDLGTLISIFIKEPYYKTERKTDSQEVHHRYCCKDSACTLEIARAQDAFLEGAPRQHYEFNLKLLDVLLYMQLDGWNFDTELAKQKELELKIAKSECLARIETHTSVKLNPGSPKQVAELLYDFKGLPRQFKKVAGRLTTKVTTDTPALLNLYKNHKDPVLFEIILYRRLGKLEDVVKAKLDKDGRLRCSYNIVGTDTGRISCSASVTGSGFNLQTVTKKLRCLFRADPGYHLFQCDLAGADGWTVAAHCLAQGDSTMWDDYKAGLKPAKIIAAMYEKGREVNQLPREQLKLICAEVDQDGWLYFGCKRVQHGTNYSLGKLTMAETIMEDSYKYLGYPIYMEPQVCVNLQGLYLSRYPGVALWQNFIKRQVLEKGFITSASGHVRKLFGRRRRGREVDHETYRAALAEEPQANTTYATMLAKERLIDDPENYTPEGLFRVVPKHTVHDALIGQFKIEDTNWAVPKLRSWFNNPITIANTTLVIPFEGGYGPSWGELPHEI